MKRFGLPLALLPLLVLMPIAAHADLAPISSAEFNLPTDAAYSPIYNDFEEIIGYAGTMWTGYYIGTFEGNDSFKYSPKKENPKKPVINVRDLVREFLGGASSLLDFEPGNYEKVDLPALSSGPLTITMTDGKSGTWALTEPAMMDFYTVKGSNAFALYYIPTPTNTGVWSTINLINGGGNPPGISHFSAITRNVSESPIPEPGTLVLMGVGILGLGILGKKK